jgi:hypothetical protein
VPNRLVDIARPPRKLAAAATALAMLAIGSAAVGASAAPAVRAADVCSVKTYPGQPVKHTTNLNLQPKYNSFPPTTGTHYQFPLKFNIYDVPLPQLLVVHNLEHGGVAVQYGSKVRAADVAKLRAWYLRDTNGVLVAPLPALGSKIALTAWNAKPYASTPPDPGRGIVATCSRFDAAEFTAFLKKHRYKAGERFPKSVLARQQ